MLKKLIGRIRRRFNTLYNHLQLEHTYEFIYLNKEGETVQKFLTKRQIDNFRTEIIEQNKGLKNAKPIKIYKEVK